MLLDHGFTARKRDRFPVQQNVIYQAAMSFSHVEGLRSKGTETGALLSHNATLKGNAQHPSIPRDCPHAYSINRRIRRLPFRRHLS